MSKTKQNILIVDNDAISLQIVSGIFSPKGINVIGAHSGELGIKKAIEIIPDLILLDIDIPGKNGFEVCENLKSNDKTNDIPIIFVSAKQNKTNIVKGLTLGAVDYIAKPFNEAKIKLRIETHFELKKSKDALIKSEEKYRGLFNGIPIGMYRTQPNGQIIDTNPALVKMFGYPNRESLLAINAKDLYVDKEKRNKELTLLTNSETFINRPLDLYRYDGTIISVINSARRIKDTNGKLLYIEGSLVDVTKQKKTEQALIESEKNYRSLTESIKDVVIQLSPEGKVLYVSPTISNFLAYEAQIPNDASFLNYFILEEDRLNAIQILKDINKHGQSGVFEFTYKPSKEIRAPFPVEISYNPLIVDNKVESIQLVMRDITERKNAEQEIRKLSMAVEQSAIIVVITDIDGNIEYTNPVFTRVTGYTQKEALGENPRILNAGTQPKQYYADMWKKISSGKVWKGEFHNKKKNGELFWDKVTITPLRNDKGEIHKYLAVKEDITKQKEHEAELDKYQNQLEILISKRTTELERSMYKFKNIFDSSSDAIVITDLHGKFIDYNKMAEKRIGLSGKKMQDLNIMEFHNLEGAKSLDDYFYGVIENGEQVFSTHFTINKQKIHIELNGKLIKHKSEDAILHISRDITERKEEEKQKLNIIIQTEEKERERFAKDLHDGIGATLSAAKMYMNTAKRT
ncbi:MAG: PAS domain S-box protein, partial [Bacteroidota bacterium]